MCVCVQCVPNIWKQLVFQLEWLSVGREKEILQIRNKK